jgi:tetratricopeptide (TPR) repeat protein
MRADLLSETEQDLSAFDIGPDGFPFPGQVLRRFRLAKFKEDGKPWTQGDLARAMKKKELAVREWERRSAGLNDIVRRRDLVKLLDIPPLLFGLATVPERQNNIESLDVPWWVQLGFPAFDAGPDGFPHPGQVLRHFRPMKLKEDGKPWTQHDLALALGKQELAVRGMELRGTGLSDISRRRFLADLFDIPPLLFGLAMTKRQCSAHIQGAPICMPGVFSASVPLDLERVRDQLTLFWTKNASASQDLLIMINSALRCLYEQFPVTSSDARLEVVMALCELHIHAANLLRDRGRFGKTLEHLNKAKDLSSLIDNEMQADVLYRRGGVYQENGELSLALDDYRAAEQMLPRISAPLQAAVLLETALCEAREAISQKKRQDVLKKLDGAGRLIRIEHTEIGRERWPYLNVDLERYHLDRSATLIIVKNSKEALQELNLLSPAHLRGRRLMYYLILQAQAHFGLKEYVQAALLAEQALPLVRQARSRVNLERIKTLHKEIQQTPFQNNPEVVRLEYLLFHA